MTAILLALSVVAARHVAWPYLCGFFGAALEDMRHAYIMVRFKWRTRSIRWKRWRHPDSTEPFTDAECRTIAEAMAEIFGER